MFLSLCNLLVFTGLNTLGLFLGLLAGYICHLPRGYPQLLGLLLGPLTILVFTWPVHRRLCWRPLFMPACPKCQHRPKFFHMAQGGWPRIELVCGECETRIEIWLCRASEVGKSDTDLPAFCLRWPEFMGWYRKIPAADGKAV